MLLWEILLLSALGVGGLVAVAVAVVAPVVASLRVLHINIYAIKWIAIVNIVWRAAMCMCVCLRVWV